MNLDTLRDVYHEQLKDMYSAEQQLIEALPKMAEKASTPELKRAFEQHMTATQNNFQLVSNLLQSSGVNPGSKKCKAMEGLIEESKEILKKEGDPQARDAGIIGAAQKVEHYEIATYGTLHSWALTLNEADAAATLKQILDQEYEADKLLTGIAESYLNEQAAR